jgi:C1A family cysteine protease
MPKLTDDITASLPDAKGRKFGWIQPIEVQDNKWTIDLELDDTSIPSVADMRSISPPVYDQGDFNSCTANAISALIAILRIKHLLKTMTPSRMFLYWFSRKSLNLETGDYGSTISATILSAIQSGYCSEQAWPYTLEHLLKAPDLSTSNEALTHKLVTPKKLSTSNQIKSAIAHGHPVAVGIRIHNSFFEADQNDGQVPMPDLNTVSFGHAGLLIGYDDTSQNFIMRNSWGLRNHDGTPCGDGGHYYLPYDYVNDGLASEFWIILTTNDS